MCAFILPPLSDLWATDLLGDLCVTVLNMLKTSQRPWRPWRCLNVICATLERPRQPFCLPSAFNGDLASFVVAQGRHKGRSPCVKGVLLAICAGNSPVPGELHSQRPVTRSFDVFFDLRLNKRLSTQSRYWWLETPWSSLWRHCNVDATLALPTAMALWNHQCRFVCLCVCLAVC